MRKNGFTFMKFFQFRGLNTFSWIVIIAFAIITSGFSSTHGVIQKNTTNGLYYIMPEGSKWGVILPDYTFKEISRKSTSRDGAGLYLHLESLKLKYLNLSLFIEPLSDFCETSIECAEKLMSGNDISVSNSDYRKVYLFDKFAVCEYYLKTWPAGYPPVEGGSKAGDEVNQLNMNAYFIKDSYWLDIHISVEGVSPEYINMVKKIFYTILSEIEIWEPTTN